MRKAKNERGWWKCLSCGAYARATKCDHCGLRFRVKKKL